MMDIINPANDEVIEKVPTDTPESIADKLNACRAAQRRCTDQPIAARVGWIRKFTNLIEENRDHLASILTAETGKPLQQSINELNGAVSKTVFFLEQSETILETQTVNPSEMIDEAIAYDPLGVIANISAWNYPWLVGINIFVPALICGNGVMYKPSEFATLTGREIQKLLGNSGIPENLFQLVIGDGSVGSELLKQDLDGYFFTGSYETGKKINQAVSHKLVPVGLELGGKDPAYIRADVPDVKSTASAVGDGAFYNNGQSCCSVERIYVDSQIHDEFVEHLLEFAASQKTGDPTRPDSTQGAITRKEHLSFLQQQVDDAVSKGAKLLTGGKIIPGTGSFFEPTVLVDVDHTMQVMQHETFGPVAPVMKVTNDDQAVELMNQSDYGLTASIYTADSTRGRDLLRRVDTGTGYLNCCDRVSAHLPWSGRGNSGLGSTLSKHGLFAFCQPKGLHLRKS